MMGVRSPKFHRNLLIQRFVQNLEGQRPVLLVSVARLLGHETGVGQADLGRPAFGGKLNPKDRLGSFCSLCGPVSRHPRHFDELVLLDIEESAVVGMPAPVIPIVEEVWAPGLRHQGERSGLGEPGVEAFCPGGEDFFWLGVDRLLAGHSQWPSGEIGTGD